MTITLLAIFTSSFVIALSGALMPGPLLTVTISESTRRGAIAGPMMILGHAILELTLVIALLTGMAPFLKQENVFIAIALIGGSVLFWMAISMFRNLPNLSLNFEVESEKPKNLIFAGILLSLANPYWTIWWASIGLGYIMHSIKFGIAGVVSSASGISGVANGRAARIFIENRLELLRMRHAEDFRHSAHVLESVDYLGPVRIVRADTGGKLAPVLKVKQHGGYQRSRVPVVY